MFWIAWMLTLVIIPGTIVSSDCSGLRSTFGICSYFLSSSAFRKSSPLLRMLSKFVDPVCGFTRYYLRANFNKLGVDFLRTTNASWTLKSQYSNNNLSSYKLYKFLNVFVFDFYFFNLNISI